MEATYSNTQIPINVHKFSNGQSLFPASVAWLTISNRSHRVTALDRQPSEQRLGTAHLPPHAVGVFSSASLQSARVSLPISEDPQVPGAGSRCKGGRVGRGAGVRRSSPSLSRAPPARTPAPPSPPSRLPRPPTALFSSPSLPSQTRRLSPPSQTRPCGSHYTSPRRLGEPDTQLSRHQRHLPRAAEARQPVKRADPLTQAGACALRPPSAREAAGMRSSVYGRTAPK